MQRVNVIYGKDDGVGGTSLESSSLIILAPTDIRPFGIKR